MAKKTEKYIKTAEKSNSKQSKNGKKCGSISGSDKSAASETVNRNSMSKSDELTLRAWKKTFENHKKAA